MNRQNTKIENVAGFSIIAKLHRTYQYASNVFPKKPGQGRRRFKFFVRSLMWPSETSQWVQRCAESAYHHIVTREPWLLERIHRPFLNAHFSARQRLRVSLEHDYYTHLAFPEISKDLNIQGAIHLAAFSVKEDTWFIRLEISSRFRQEGDWTLSIRDASGARLVSCAFCIASIAGKVKRPRLLIGCVQGQPRSDDGKASVRKLTKQWAGLRPKCLVVTLTQALAAQYGAQNTLLVTDQSHISANRRYAWRRHRFSARYNAFAGELDARHVWKGWHIMRMPALVKDRGAITERTAKNKHLLVASIIAQMQEVLEGASRRSSESFSPDHRLPGAARDDIVQFRD